MYKRICGKISANLPQWDFLQDFVNGSSRLQEALEIDEFLHVSMEIGFLLDAFTNLQEKLLVDQLLDAANGEVRHEVLTVAEVAQVIEGIQEVGFEVKQGLGLVVHAKPKDAGHVVAPEESGVVEIHSERLVFFGYFLASLNDSGDIFCRGIANKFQSQVYLVGFHIVDILLVLEVFLKSFDQGRKLRAARDGNGQESSFRVHRIKN